MTKTAFKNVLRLAALVPLLSVICACTDELDIARQQARGGAYKIAIESYKAYLARNPGDKRKAAELNFEIGTLLVKDNRKEAALLAFKKAAEAGYPADKLRLALREQVGELMSPNLPATREVLKQICGVNEDFKEYADIQLYRLQGLETEARRLASLAQENIAQAKFDEARENLSKAKTLVPGINMSAATELLKDLPAMEAAFFYELDVKAAFHIFDKTREYRSGPRFDSAAYNKFKTLEKEDALKRKEINDVIKYKAQGNTAKERAENEATPGARYKDFLYRKYGMKFTVSLPEYDEKRRGFDISAQYEAPPCRGLDLKFPVIEIPEDRAAALAGAKTPALVEIMFNVVPKNISPKLGKEIIGPGCEILSGRASLDEKTVYIPKKK